MKIPDNILFFRHGESLHNVSPEAWSFHNDDVLGLTMEGAKQAHKAGQALACSQHKDRIFGYEVWCSPQIRAIQTASVLVTSFATERRIVARKPTVCPELQEFFCNQSGESAEDFDFDVFLQEPHRRYSMNGVTLPELRRTLSILDLLSNASEFYNRITESNISWSHSWDHQKGRLDHLVVSHHFTIAAMLTFALLSREPRSTWYITSGRYLVDDVNSKEFQWWTDLCRLIVKLPIKHCTPYSPMDFSDLLSPIRNFLAK